MIKNITALATTLLIAGAATTGTLFAQDDKPERDGKRRGAPPLMSALDENKDGTIDAVEIANAPTALATLDTNNDGELSRDEIRPERGNRGGGKRGPGGKGGRGQGGDAPVE